MIADTSFVIDVMRSNEAAIQKEQIMEKEGILISLTAVSIFELFVGVTLSVKQKEERKRIVDVLKGLVVLPLDEESAKEAGTIYAEKREAGVNINPEDAMIAGICRVRNEPVLTRNTKHYTGIDGVRVEPY